MFPDGILQKRIELFLRVVKRPITVIAVRQGPISLGASVSITPFEPMRGRKLFDSVNKRPRTWYIVKGQVAVEARHAQTAFNFRMD